MTTLEQAAEARRRQVRAPADRPSQRRSRDEPGGSSHPSYRARIEIRDASDGGMSFEGIASATEQPYEMWDWAGPYSEVVSAGAFTDTLARVGLDVPLVLGHDQMRRIARTVNGTLVLSEVDDGLRVYAPDLDPSDPDVAYAAPKLRSGLYNEMSFAFRIDAGMWSPDYTEYRITKVDLHRGDVSIVGFGANPFTSAGLRSQPEPVRRMSRTVFDLRYGERK